MGEGDDDGSLEGDFRGWKAQFWEMSAAAFGTSSLNDSTDGGGPRPPPIPPRFVSAFTLTPLPSAQQSSQRAKYLGGLANLITDPKHRVVIAAVVENRELRQSVEDDGSTRHVELDLSNVSLPYLTADNCGVYPRNDYKTVASVIKRLQLDGAELLLMKGNGSKRAFLPSPCSVQDMLLYYLDITFTPRLSQLPLFTHYCSEEKDRALLLYWSKQGGDEYLGDQKTFVELLEELPSLSPPLSDLVDFIPHLAPRFYTISSSSLVQPKRLSLTVSVLTHHKPRGRKQKGLCSGYLSSLRPDKDSVAIFIRPSSFRLPKPRPPPPNLPSTSSATTASAPVLPPPILMVGPGTGVAPFRGFLQEATAGKMRERATAGEGQGSASTPPPQPSGYGDLILFFGCRSSTKDFIYKQELLQAVQDGVLTQLHVAFSREQPPTTTAAADPSASEQSVDPSSTAAATASLAAASSLAAETAQPLTAGAVGRVYVQDRMRKVGDSVWEAIHTKKGHLFVCGGTAMGRAVREVLLDCCKERGGMTDKQAELYIKKLQEQKRFIQELWS